MKKEIVTRVLKKPELWDELAFLVKHLAGNGQTNVEVLFGWAWGEDYYSKDKWEYGSLPLQSLASEVKKAEEKEYGKLGSDDLCVRVAPLNLQLKFCNDSDLHLEFDGSDSVVESFYKRWKELGYHPTEWTKDEQGKPTVKVREN